MAKNLKKNNAFLGMPQQVTTVVSSAMQRFVHLRENGLMVQQLSDGWIW